MTDAPDVNEPLPSVPCENVVDAVPLVLVDPEKDDSVPLLVPPLPVMLHELILKGTLVLLFVAVIVIDVVVVLLVAFCVYDATSLKVIVLS